MTAGGVGMSTGSRGIGLHLKILVRIAVILPKCSTVSV